MRTNRYIPYRGVSPAQVLYVEKRLLEKEFDFLSVKVSGSTLYAKGFCQPSAYSITYEYKLKFSPGGRPKVYPVQPQIVYNDNIHMYSKDNSLCLYYPKDYSFTSCSHLFNTIIPWTHEWFLYYELYVLKGQWLHPYVDHKKI